MKNLFNKIKKILGLSEIDFKKVRAYEAKALKEIIAEKNLEKKANLMLAQLTREREVIMKTIDLFKKDKAFVFKSQKLLISINFQIIKLSELINKDKSFC